MLDTLITLTAVAAGAPLAVWVASRPTTTPRTWRHHAELAVGVALLACAVATAIAAACASGG
jgi:hypothetical protein